jgi:hypothetical protein
MRAQVAVEFMIIFGIFLVALIIILIAVWSDVADMNRANIELSVNNLLEKVSSKIDTVFLEGDGFSSNITIPETISGLNYSIGMFNGAIWIEVNNITYSKNLLTKNVTGSFNKGQNLLRNENGEVIIT